jgi:E3 ubiquitin-protein ligase DOA10
MADFSSKKLFKKKTFRDDDCNVLFLSIYKVGSFHYVSVYFETVVLAAVFLNRCLAGR